MSLEESLDRCSNMLDKLISALSKGVPAVGGTPAATTDAKRPPGRPKAVTLDEVRAIAEKLSDKKGKPAVREIIKSHGAAQLADMDKSKYPAFIAACEVLLNEDESGEDDSGGDDAL